MRSGMTARKNPRSAPPSSLDLDDLDLTPALEAAKRHAPALIGAGAAVSVLALVVALRHRARTRRRERLLTVLQIGGSLLRPGFTVRPPEPPPSVLKTTFTNVGKDLLSLALRELGRRALGAAGLATHA